MKKEVLALKSFPEFTVFKWEIDEEKGHIHIKEISVDSAKSIKESIKEIQQYFEKEIIETKEDWKWLLYFKNKQVFEYKGPLKPLSTKHVDVDENFLLED